MAKYKMAFRFINDNGDLCKGVQADYDYYMNESMSSGAYGILYELENAETSSRKNGLAKQGRADNYIRVKWDNAKGYKMVKAESKTNGGRVGYIMELAKRSPNYPIIYSISLDCELKDGTVVERDAFNRLFTAKEFIDLLTECKAIKECKEAKSREQKTASARRDYQIQVIKASWFEAVEQWPRVFIKGAENVID